MITVRTTDTPEGATAVARVQGFFLVDGISIGGAPWPADRPIVFQSLADALIDLGFTIKQACLTLDDVRSGRALYARFDTSNRVVTSAMKF